MTQHEMKTSHRLAVALDVPTADDALKLAETLSPLGVRFKIGMQLFYAEGMGLVRRIQAMQPDVPVFVDLKLHDIPNTVACATRSLVAQEVTFFNVHTQGGPEMMRAAAAAAREAAKGAPPVIIGVTILTSMPQTQLSDYLHVPDPLEDYVLHLAQSAKAAGLDGVVCSAREARRLREACGPDFLLVTPGVRPVGADTQDQSRIVTPAQALRNGSDILVIGRPITGAPDPAEAAQAILAEMEAALLERPRVGEGAQA